MSITVSYGITAGEKGDMFACFLTKQSKNQRKSEFICYYLNNVDTSIIDLNVGNLVFHNCSFKCKKFRFKIQFQNLDKDNGQIVHVINSIGPPDSGSMQEVTVFKTQHMVHFLDESQLNGLKF